MIGHRQPAWLADALPPDDELPLDFKPQHGVNGMRNTQWETAPANLVTVALADRALSFLLPVGATFGDLAASLANLDESSAELPAAFYLKIDMGRGAALPRRIVKFPASIGQPVLPLAASGFN